MQRYHCSEIAAAQHQIDPALAHPDTKWTRKSERTSCGHDPGSRGPLGESVGENHRHRPSVVDGIDHEHHARPGREASGP